MCIFVRDSDETNNHPNEEKKDKETKPVILHLDDDSDFLDIFVLVFHEWLDITSVSDGKTALELLKERKFDAVITDYDMPELDGLKFLKELRKSFDNIPVMFYTGQGNEEVAREAFIMGATDYFTKELYSFAHKEKFVNSIKNAIKRNRTEKAKEESDGKFRELFHNVNDAIFLYNVQDRDKAGKFIEVNDVACYRLGYSREELLNMTPVDINAFMEESEFSLFIKKIESKGRLTVESAHITKDGKIVPVEVSTHIFSLGEEKAVLSVARDISERLKTRKMIQESEKKFRLLYNEAPVPYQSLDDKGNFLDINNSWLELLGYKKEDIIGKHFTDFLVQEDITKFSEGFRNFKKVGNVHNRIYKMKKKDGNIVTVELEGRIALDEDGKVKQTHCIFQDISQKIKDEERIRHLNRVLKAIRNVNQLIVKKKNRDILLKEVCELLIETGGYGSSWIILMDENKNFIDIYEAGVKSRHDFFYDDIRAGNFPACVLSAMKEDDIIVVTKRKEICENCLYKEEAINNTRMSVCLKHNDRIFGALVVSIPSCILVDEEEKSLLCEVADDISYALSNLELEDKRREILSSLYHREEMLREIFNNIHSGIAVYQAINDGEDFIFTQFNNAAQKIEKINKEDLMGKRVREVFPGIKECGLFQVFQRVWKTGVPEHFPVTLYSDDRIKGWRENFVFKLSTGEIVAIYDNVTDFHQIKESLRIRENIVETSLNAIAMAGFDGKLTYVNKSFIDMWGYDIKEEVIGKYANEFWKVPEEAMEVTRKINEHGQWTGELEAKRKDGSTFQAYLLSHVIRDSRGDFFCIAASFIDISELKRIERVARKSEKKLNDILQSIPYGVQELDPSGKITYVNQAYNKIYGYDNNELIGKFIYELPQDERNQKRLKDFLEKIRKEEPSPTPYFSTNCKKDGTLIDIQVDWLYKRDENGKLTGFISIVSDITEKNRINKALKESEQKYRMVFENSGTALVIFKENTSISLANTEFERLSGFSLNELEKGKSVLDFVHPDDLEKIKENLHKRRIPGQTLPPQYEFRFVDKNGIIKNVLLTIDLMPETSQSIASLLDITHLKEIETELRESQDKLKTVIKNMPVMMDAFDENMILTEWNRECERVTGYSAKEMIGNPEAISFMYPDEEYRKELINTINKISRNFRDMETEVTCKNGSKKTISWSNISDRFPIPGWDSWAIGVDVTYRKSMENKLISKNRELSDFAYRTSHDLKNPLFVLKGFMNIIREEPAFFNEYFQKITDKLDYLILFIDNLLSLSRAGKIINRMEKINIKPLLNDIFLKHKDMNINSEIIISGELQTIEADLRGITSIFSNLIQNSMKYFDPKKDKLIIQIDCDTKDDNMRIIYRDNGMGINKDMEEKIFEPGFTGSKYKGTGFGLAIVKKIIEAHNGIISAHSEGAGKGIEFTIILPLE